MVFLLTVSLLFPNYRTVQLEYKPSRRCLLLASPPLGFIFTSPSQSETRQQVAVITPLCQLHCHLCQQGRVFVLFFQHDWLPQVTEHIKLLITSKHKTSGSLAAKRTDLCISFKPAVVSFKLKHQWNKNKISKDPVSNSWSWSSKQFCQQQGKTVPMRAFSFYFCGFSVTIKLQDKAIWTGSPPKTRISYKKAVG